MLCEEYYCRSSLSIYGREISLMSNSAVFLTLKVLVTTIDAQWEGMGM